MNNTLATTRQTFNAPAGHSLFETFLVVCLLTIMGAGAWSLFASMPAYGGPQPTPPPVFTQQVAVQPVCFNHTRQDVLAQDPQTMADIAAGCPSDPMAYNPGTVRQSQG